MKIDEGASFKNLFFYFLFFCADFSIIVCHSLRQDLPIMFTTCRDKTVARKQGYVVRSTIKAMKLLIGRKKITVNQGFKTVGTEKKHVHTNYNK